MEQTWIFKRFQFCRLDLRNRNDEFKVTSAISVIEIWDYNIYVIVSSKLDVFFFFFRFGILNNMCFAVDTGVPHNNINFFWITQGFWFTRSKLSVSVLFLGNLPRFLKTDRISFCFWATGSVFVSGQPTSVLKNRPRQKIRSRVVYVLSVNCPRLMST